MSSMFIQSLKCVPSTLNDSVVFSDVQGLQKVFSHCLCSGWWGCLSPSPSTVTGTVDGRRAQRQGKQRTWVGPRTTACCLQPGTPFPALLCLYLQIVDGNVVRINQGNRAEPLAKSPVYCGNSNKRQLPLNCKHV